MGVDVPPDRDRLLQYLVFKGDNIITVIEAKSSAKAKELLKQYPGAKLALVLE